MSGEAHESVTDGAHTRSRVRPTLDSLLAAVIAVTGSVSLGMCVFWPAQAQIAVRNQGYIPYSDAPINYRTQDPVDPVALLQKRLDAGTASLAFDEHSGYLRSTLDLLGIPISSQTLVFSKTSFQHEKITPQYPRALFYNDDVYVGAVHQGKALEIISFDPMQGAMFYVLDEHKVDKPVFQRAELDCTQCHIAPGTRGVPGVFLQSVYPTATGSAASRAPFYITDQKSPLKERWGGWYVSGELGDVTMANAVVPAAQTPAESRVASKAPDLEALTAPFEKSPYLLAPGSDQVAMLVLAHQTQMHNLITLTNYQTRLALHALGLSPADAPGALDALPEKQREQIRAPAEQLLRYLLFAKETPLGGLDGERIIRSSEFAREFQAIGVRDSRNRSLRDFDLSNRTFRYPCSYLIYSSAFDALPEPAKGYVYRRLLEILGGQDQGPDFAHLTQQDREAILSILLETKQGLPPEWRAYAHPAEGRSETGSPADTRGKG